jgi:hypothetical protein
MRTYETFELLARTTWRLIRDSELNKISMGEDAITSYHLTAIAASRPLNVLYEDTRIDESRKGCDFELWVGSDYLGWHRYAIQAKKVKPNTGRYEALGHKVGGVRQIDILKKYALANNATPLYCFYNHSKSPIASNCTDPTDIEQLGCTLATIGGVEAALKKRGGRTFAFIHSLKSTLPWRCLVKCPKFIPGSPLTKPTIHNHPNLPGSLNALRSQWKQGSSRAMDIDPGGLFNLNLALRPARLAIIDLGDEHDG